MGIKPSKALLERGERPGHRHRDRKLLLFGLEWIWFLGRQPGLEFFNTGEDFSAGHMFAGSGARLEAGMASLKITGYVMSYSAHRTAVRWLAGCRC